MLTQCSQCSTVFRLYASQLGAAHGFVTCGECHTVFNALSRLADELPAPAMIELSPSGALSPALDLNDVPAILRDDVAKLMRRRGVGMYWAWSVLALVALITLTAQLGWQYRAQWRVRYPAAVPYAEKLCANLGCSLAPTPSVEGIELVARDVREHPQYRHTLLVNATLANRSATPVAYPIIQLGIYDRNGGVVGVRRFAPTEYLDASIDIVRGMPVGRSVYVVLEIAGASEIAENFEFTFL